MKTSTRCLLFCHTFLCSIFLCHGTNLFFNDKEKLQLPQSYNIAWMASIQDSLTLSRVTIPGTHDSMAHYGGPAAKCQAWQLKDQLTAGIRYLDLRVFALKDTLYAMHGVIYQHTSLREILDTVRAFLLEFGSETVLIRVKPRFLHKDRVNQMVQNLINNDPHIWMSSSMPTMGQVRGKIVFVQKSPFMLGLTEKETDTKGDFKVTHVKDKENDIKKHLSQATEDCGGDSVVLTYSSGTGIGTFLGMFETPKRVAEKVNPWLDHCLKQFYPNRPRPCFAVIAMDFPGIDLIQTVVGFNSR